MMILNTISNNWITKRTNSQSIKRLKKALFATLITLLGFTSAFSQNQVVGKWLSEDKEGITEIYEQGGKYFGKITWLKTPNDNKGNLLTDNVNPEKGKRNQSLIGLIILKNLSYKNNEWTGGSIYDPESGKTYTCKIWLNEDKLKLRGYLGIFYETQEWTRTK